MRTAVLTYNTSHYILLFRQNLIRALQSEGFHVVAMAPPDRHSPRFAAIGVTYVPIRMDNKGVNPVRDLQLLIDLYTTYRRLRPSVALHFTIKPNIYGSIAARLLGIPVINNVTGLGTAFVRGGLLQAISERLYRIAFRRAQVVFFQNDVDRALFLQNGIVSKHQSCVLPGSGVDTHRFAPRPPAASRQAFCFLFVGRVIADKGIREFVEAVRRLKTEGRELRAMVLGQLGVQNRGAITEGEVRRWVENGLIEYLGERDDVRDAIADADCIVLPSYREGTSKTLLEAASMAKPLIAADVPGCNNIVRPEVNGYLCRMADAADLALAMSRMMELSDMERTKMGAEGRRLVTENFDERIVIDQYMAALVRLEKKAA